MAASSSSHPSSVSLSILFSQNQDASKPSSLNSSPQSFTFAKTTYKTALSASKKELVVTSELSSSASSSDTLDPKELKFNGSAVIGTDPLCCCFSPDSKFLITGGLNNNISQKGAAGSSANNGTQNHIHIWNPQTKKVVHSLAGHTNSVFSLVSFKQSPTPDGKASKSSDPPLLASASADCTVKIWSLSSTATSYSASAFPLLCTIRAHARRINAVVYCSQQQTLISAANDKTIKFWKRENSASNGRKGAKDSSASASSDQKQQWKCMDTITVTAKAYALAISPDGSVLASGHNDGSIILWDLSSSSRSQIQSWKAHSSKVFRNGLSFAQHDNSGQHLLASAANDKLIKVWSISSTGRVTTQIGASIPISNTFVFSPCLFTSNGNHVLGVHPESNKMSVWDISSSECIRTLEESPSSPTVTISSACVSPDNRYLACTMYSTIDNSSMPFYIWKTSASSSSAAAAAASQIVNSIAIPHDVPVDDVHLLQFNPEDGSETASVCLLILRTKTDAKYSICSIRQSYKLSTSFTISEWKWIPESIINPILHATTSADGAGLMYTIEEDVPKMPAVEASPPPSPVASPSSSVSPSSASSSSPISSSASVSRMLTSAAKLKKTMALSPVKIKGKKPNSVASPSSSPSSSSPSSSSSASMPLPAAIEENKPLSQPASVAQAEIVKAKVVDQPSPKQQQQHPQEKAPPHGEKDNVEAKTKNEPEIQHVEAVMKQQEAQPNLPSVPPLPVAVDVVSAEPISESYPVPQKDVKKTIPLQESKSEAVVPSPTLLQSSPVAEGHTIQPEEDVEISIAVPSSQVDSKAEMESPTPLPANTNAESHSIQQVHVPSEVQVDSPVLVHNNPPVAESHPIAQIAQIQDIQQQQQQQQQQHHRHLSPSPGPAPPHSTHGISLSRSASPAPRSRSVSPGSSRISMEEQKRVLEDVERRAKKIMAMASGGGSSNSSSSSSSGYHSRSHSSEALDSLESHHQHYHHSVQQPEQTPVVAPKAVRPQLHQSQPNDIPLSASSSSPSSSPISFSLTPPTPKEAVAQFSEPRTVPQHLQSAVIQPPIPISSDEQSLQFLRNQLKHHNPSQSPPSSPPLSSSPQPTVLLPSSSSASPASSPPPPITSISSSLASSPSSISSQVVSELLAQPVELESSEETKIKKKKTKIRHSFVTIQHQAAAVEQEKEEFYSNSDYAPISPEEKEIQSLNAVVSSTSAASPSDNSVIDILKFLDAQKPVQPSSSSFPRVLSSDSFTFSPLLYKVDLVQSSISKSEIIIKTMSSSAPAPAPASPSPSPLRSSMTSPTSPSPASFFSPSRSSTPRIPSFSPSSPPVTGRSSVSSEAAAVVSKDWSFIKTVPSRANIHSCCFSPDSTLFATAGSGDHNTIRIWNPSTLECVHSFTGHTDSINCLISFQSAETGQNLLASASNDKTIRIWGFDDLKLIWTLDDSSSSSDHRPYSLVYCPQYDLLISGSSDICIKFWKKQKSGQWKAIDAQICPSRVFAVSVSFDGALLASGHGDGTIIVWQISTRTLVRRWKATVDQSSITANGLSFSPNDHRLASCSFDGKLQVWNASNGSIIGTPIAIPKRQIYLPCLFSTYNGGRHSVVGVNQKHQLSMWDASTSKRICVLDQSPELIPSALSACFSSDGKYLACTVYKDERTKSLHMWEAAVSSSSPSPSPALPSLPLSPVALLQRPSSAVVQPSPVIISRISCPDDIVSMHIVHPSAKAPNVVSSCLLFIRRKSGLIGVCSIEKTSSSSALATSEWKWIPFSRPCVCASPDGLSYRIEDASMISKRTLPIPVFLGKGSSALNSAFESASALAASVFHS